MAATQLRTERPSSPEQAAGLLRELGEAATALRVRGGGTKSTWGAPGEPVGLQVDTTAMDAVLEHNVGDFTAVVQAGVPLAGLQERLAAHGQMLALDPPDGGATIGGVVATADSGPLRHRYGGVRDLVVGISAALSDGSLVHAGGRVIKNVAGYDLAKVLAGSLDTLGLITTVSLRLHPRAETTATAVATSGDPDVLGRAAGVLAGLPLEADCLDAGWADGRGRLLVRFAGPTARSQAERVLAHMTAAGLSDAEVAAADEEIWDAQRAAQRADAVLKVSALPTDLPSVLRAAEAVGATAVSRAALGLSWIAMRGADGDLAPRVTAVRDALAPRACTLLDGPAVLRDAVGVWPAVDPVALAVMGRLKARFDPARIFHPGAHVGGL
jgi:glycolate oxidase FAD binding subunit